MDQVQKTITNEELLIMFNALERDKTFRALLASLLEGYSERGAEALPESFIEGAVTVVHGNKFYKVKNDLTT